jgi:NAD(P)-dependent dehydrogenase (short-subunit alcohol dehydrogenase family)
MGKVALITGANKGIGLETARQLGEMGYTVLVGARDEDRGKQAEVELKNQGIDAEFVHLDMDNADTFAKTVEHIESKYGHLDALVNNAGINLDFGMSAVDVPLDTIRKTFDVNLFAQIDISQRMIPLLKKSPAGRIVNLSSILGSLTLNADPKSAISDWRSLGYNASKAALNAFTAILSYHLQGTNIKVNSAHPGWVKTDLGGENAPMELEDGAKTSVWLATLPEDGPTGGYFHMQERLPW